MGQPRTLRQTRSRPLREDREEDGGDADLVGSHLDRGSVRQEGCGYAGDCEDDAQVDLRYGFLVSDSISLLVASKEGRKEGVETDLVASRLSVSFLLAASSRTTKPLSSRTTKPISNKL